MKRSGHAQLGRSLYAAIRENQEAQLAFQADKLLHLLPPDEILAAARGRPGALYSLSWRRLAQRQPGAALILIRLALSSCEHPLALQSRWKLVRQHLPLPSSALLCDRHWHMLPRLSGISLFQFGLLCDQNWHTLPRSSGLHRADLVGGGCSMAVPVP